MDYLHCQLDALERILSGEKTPDSLDLHLLRQLTENFSDDRRIGEGGCGEVYKGILPSGVVIAVKKLKNSHTIDEKMFHREVDSMTKVDSHTNIVRFIGYCSETKEKALQMNGKTVMAEERERLLCFEYIRKGSLDNYLTDELRGFEWHTRYQIIKGICYGLLHLHKENGILHMDLKPANILLSDQLVPKITDFGLSRIEGISQTTSAQRLLSPGYCAPEYIENGKRSWKSDIYSLGVIMIELVTGSRQQVPNITKVLRRWRHRWSKSSKHMPLWYQQVKKCLEMAMSCKERNPISRPFIWEVVRELNKLDSWDGQIRDSSLEKIISSSDDMLGIEPLELYFPLAHEKQISCSIDLTNDTDYYMAFRIEKTGLLPFSIQPDKGIAAPRSKCVTSITLSAQEMRPLHDLCEEEFIVQSTRIDGSLTAMDIIDGTFNDEGGNSQKDDGYKVVDEVNLTVLFNNDMLQQSMELSSYREYEDSSENGRFSYGVASSPGKRASMEDFYFYEARIDDVDGETVGMFGVYDGHGGNRAAVYVKQHLFSNLIKHPKFITDTKAAIAETYNHTDSEFLKADSSQTGDAGSTASTAIIVGDRLLVANVGDSRAVISKGGQAIAVSRDHKPDQTDERQRIEDAGGFVVWAGTWRVGGVLAVSRAFGNKLLKQYVVADPEIKEEVVDSSLEFLILASHGLWDVVTNEEAVAMVTPIQDPQEAANKLLEEASRRGSSDNITVIIVRFLYFFR